MIYKSGTKLVDRESGAVFVVSASDAKETHYQGASGRGSAKTSEIAVIFEADAPEEFRGYMKGTAIAYLAREQDKGGMLDIKKATHTLQGLTELLGAE